MDRNGLLRDERGVEPAPLLVALTHGRIKLRDVEEAATEQHINELPVDCRIA